MTRISGINLHDFDSRLRPTFEAFPPPIRVELLRILTLPDEERARAIGELFAEGRMPETAELLMDLEEEPGIRAWVVTELTRFVE